MKNIRFTLTLVAFAFAATSCGKSPDPDQAPKAEFSVTPTSLTFTAEPEGTQEITVTAENVEWSVEVNTEAAGWLTAEKSEGAITVTATANDDTEPRTGTITVTPGSEDFEPVTVAVSQEGKTFVPTFPEAVDFNMIFVAEYNGDKFGNNRGGANFVVTFMNVVDVENAIFESFTLEGFMPQVADETQNFVPVAVGDYFYELAESYTGTPFTFLGYYGEVSNAGSFYTSTLLGIDNQLFYKVSGGTVKIEDAGMGNVTITAEVVNETGNEMTLTYTGPLILDNTLTDNGIASFDTTFDVCSSASHLGQYFEQPVREYEFRFSKQTVEGADNIGEVLVLRFNADIDSPVNKFPSGRYFPHSSEKYAPRAPFTYMRGGYTFGITAGSYYGRESALYATQQMVLIDQDGGYIDVTDHGDGTYTFKVIADGTYMDTELNTAITSVNFNFTGPITIQNRE